MPLAMTSAERAALPVLEVDPAWMRGERLLSTTVVKRRPDELSVKVWRGRGRTERTDVFAELVIRLAVQIGGALPLAFRDAEGNPAMLDWGCIGYLAKHSPPELNLILDAEGFVAAVEPTQALLDRYGAAPSGQPRPNYWSALAATLGRSDAGWSQSEQSWVRTMTRQGLYVSCVFNVEAGWVRVGLTAAGDEAENHFMSLLAQRGQIERRIGEALEWNAKPDRNERQIYRKILCDPAAPLDWPRQHAWIAERLPRFENLLESFA